MKDFKKVDWAKMNGLIPAIVQDEATQKVLMLGYMNEIALAQTLRTQLVTFYSRSTQKIWVKGETSGNTLALRSIDFDCDNDTFLVIVKPSGPVCHLGASSCFGERDLSTGNMLLRLETIIKNRQQENNKDSYVVKLLKSGVGRIAQKVGEEGVEVALAAALENNDTLAEEVADLLFHVMVLLRAKDISFNVVLKVLEKRVKPASRVCG